jgi:hypothetical protein
MIRKIACRERGQLKRQCKITFIRGPIKQCLAPPSLLVVSLLFNILKPTPVPPGDNTTYGWLFINDTAHKHDQLHTHTRRILQAQRCVPNHCTLALFIVSMTPESGHILCQKTCFVTRYIPPKWEKNCRKWPFFIQVFLKIKYTEAINTLV